MSVQGWRQQGQGEPSAELGKGGSSLSSSCLPFFGPFTPASPFPGLPCRVRVHPHPPGPCPQRGSFSRQICSGSFSPSPFRLHWSPDLRGRRRGRYVGSLKCDGDRTHLGSEPDFKSCWTPFSSTNKGAINTYAVTRGIQRSRGGVEDRATGCGFNGNIPCMRLPSATPSLRGKGQGGREEDPGRSVPHVALTGHGA